MLFLTTPLNFGTSHHVDFTLNRTKGSYRRNQGEFSTSNAGDHEEASFWRVSQTQSLSFCAFDSASILIRVRCSTITLASWILPLNLAVATILRFAQPFLKLSHHDPFALWTSIIPLYHNILEGRKSKGELDTVLCHLETKISFYIPGIRSYAICITAIYGKYSLIMNITPFASSCCFS